MKQHAIVNSVIYIAPRGPEAVVGVMEYKGAMAELYLTHFIMTWLPMYLYATYISVDLCHLDMYF